MVLYTIKDRPLEILGMTLVKHIVENLSIDLYMFAPVFRHNDKTGEMQCVDSSGQIFSTKKPKAASLKYQIMYGLILCTTEPTRECNTISIHDRKYIFEALLQGKEEVIKMLKADAFFKRKFESNAEQFESNAEYTSFLYSRPQTKKQ